MEQIKSHLRQPRVTIRVPLLSTLGGSRIHFKIRVQCHLVVYRSCAPQIVIIASQSESLCYTYVGELKMAATNEEKVICVNFNLEALTVNQMKVSKLWQTGKMFSLKPKREVANRCHMRAFRCHFCLHFVDNVLRVKRLLIGYVYWQP